MKNLLLLLAFVLFCSLAPDNPVPLKITPMLVIAVLVGIYEVVARIIPSVGQNGVIGKIIDVLKWLSDSLNRNRSPKT